MPDHELHHNSITPQQPIDWNDIPPPIQQALVMLGDAIVMGRKALIALLWVFGAIGIVAGAIYYWLGARHEWRLGLGAAGVKLKAFAAAVAIAAGLGVAAVAYSATVAPQRLDAAPSQTTAPDYRPPLAYRRPHGFVVRETDIVERRSAPKRGHVAYSFIVKE